jgi:glycosyltransferase involved in cell wall biosynthesis
MRVGLVIYGSLDQLTGGYLYDRKLVEHLSGCGDEVEVISLPWRGYGRHLCDNASRSLARRLDCSRFDVLLQDELNHPSLVLANRRLKGRAACPIVAVVHVLRTNECAASPLVALYAAAERRYLDGVDAAIFCCEATRAQAERLVRRPLPGVVVHPACDHLGGPVPEREVSARARRGGPLRVISVANVVARKGLLSLVEALARLPREEWTLTVAGSLTMDRGYVRRVRRLIEAAGVGANVELLGAVANEQVRGLLAAADVQVVASSYEGLAIAYLEAMHCGVPVIATSAGGADEVIEHGCEGWLVAPGDVDALSAHLAQLAEDRDLLLRLSLAARRRAERHPTWEYAHGRSRAFLRSVVHDEGWSRGERAA